MSEALLQILLILAYLAIGLISVTFPIYAICATYLKQEKWESEKECKKRIERAKSKISELTEKLGGEHDAERVNQLREQIGKYEIELKGAELGVQYLTAKGAVGIPVSYLVITLGAVGIGVYGFYEENWLVILICGVISGFFSFGALYTLYKTISAVEYACLRSARTVDFKVSYGTGEEIKEIKVKKETQLSIGGGSEDEDLEYFEINFFLHPDIKLSKIVTMGAYGSLQPKGATYHKYFMITREKGFVGRDTAVAVDIIVSANKVGRYLIPVEISAKGVYRYKANLAVDVVK